MVERIRWPKQRVTKGWGTRRARHGWIVLLPLACGDDSTALGGGGGHGDASTTTMGDPADMDFDDACEAAGGAYGIVAGPLTIADELGVATPGSFSALGLVAHEGGLWAKLHFDPQGGEEPGSYGVDLDLDGHPSGPAVRNDTAWADGRVWPGPDGAVVTYCRDHVPGWVVVDVRGEPRMDPVTPPTFADCLDEPAAAWTTAGEILLTWIARESETPDCTTGSCAVLAAMELDRPVQARSLHPVGDWGVGPTSSVAAGPEGAMVVVLAWTGHADDTAVFTTLTDGSEPALHWLAPPSDGRDTKFSHARAVADESDGFFVFVGGYGPSMARMHVGGDGRVLEPLVELPVFHDEPVYGVYERDRIEIAPRLGGSIVYGSAGENTQTIVLLTAVDPRGEPRAQIVLPSRRIAMASYADRTWALHDYYGGPLQITELGCVLEP